MGLLQRGRSPVLPQLLVLAADPNRDPIGQQEGASPLLGGTSMWDSLRTTDPLLTVIPTMWFLGRHGTGRPSHEASTPHCHTVQVTQGFLVIYGFVWFTHPRCRPRCGHDLRTHRREHPSLVIRADELPRSRCHPWRFRRTCRTRPGRRGDRQPEGETRVLCPATLTFHSANEGHVDDGTNPSSSR
jgi:hypothetical protein